MCSISSIVIFISYSFGLYTANGIYFNVELYTLPLIENIFSDEIFTFGT